MELELIIQLEPKWCKFVSVSVSNVSSNEASIRMNIHEEEVALRRCQQETCLANTYIIHKCELERIHIGDEDACIHKAELETACRMVTYVTSSYICR